MRTINKKEAQEFLDDNPPQIGDPDNSWDCGQIVEFAREAAQTIIITPTDIPSLLLKFKGKLTESDVTKIKQALTERTNAQ